MRLSIHGEIGELRFTQRSITLNQIIHVWPYKDLNERERIRV